MEHSGAIRNGVLEEVGTAEHILKTRKPNGAFWRYLKRCIESWNCLENLKAMHSVS